MDTKIYNQKGAETGTMTLPESIFGLPLNRDLVQQARVASEANSRKPVAHSKDRSEVRGGGRKPWRQKGTGRARHGSRRSPIWKGGGVTHGPRKEKNYAQKLNTAMAKKALKTILSAKFKNGQIKIINDLTLENYKTKEFVNLMKDMAGLLDNKKTSVLFILDKKNINLVRASANVSRVKIAPVAELNILDALKFGNIVFTEKAVKALNK